MGFLTGNPPLNQFVIGIVQFDLCAFQLFLTRDIGLAYRHFSLAVGNGISPRVIRCLGDNRLLISRNLSFRHSVLDFLFVLQLQQVVPGILPVVGSVQFNGSTQVLAVRLQLNHNFVGTDLGLVVLIVPDLFNRNVCRLQCVGDAGAGHDLVESGNSIFINGICDLGLAVIAVLRQLAGGEAPLAVIARLHSQGFNGGGAVLDINRNLTGQQCGIITLQVPDLLTAHLRDLRNKGVRDVSSGHNLLEAGRHFFIHRIVDGVPGALFILRQVAGRECPLVVGAGGNRQRLNRVISLLNIYSDAGRHECFVIALHIPGLFAGDLHGLQRVGNTLAAYDLLEAGNRFFINCIVDLCRSVFFKLRQILGGKAPLAVRSSRHSQGISDLIAVLDVDRNAFRQQVFAVVLQNPDLFAADLGSLQGVCNGEDEGSIHRLADARGIIVDRVFGNHIVYILTLILLREILPGISPVVLLIQLNGTNLVSVSQQVHGHFVRTITKRVVIVLPFLGDLHFGFFSCMSIGQGCDRAVRRIAGQRVACRQIFFSPGIGDQLSVGILRQVFDGSGPVVRRVQCHFRTVAQLNSQALRTDTVLVILIVPDLLHARFGLRRSMGVLNRVREGSFSVSCDRGGITINRVFGNGIFDVVAVGLRIEFRPAVSPAVALVQFNRLFFYTVSHQPHGNAGGTDAILVIRVLPDLLHGNFGIFRNMLVRNVILEITVLALVDGDFGVIVFHRIFFNGVLNILAFFLFGQVLPGISPLIGFVQSDALDYLVVRQQVDLHGIRSVAILVAGILPDLGDCQFGFFAGMAVRYVILEVSFFILVFGNAGCIVRYRIFCNGVINILSALFLLQACKGVGPAVAFIQGSSYAGIHAVCQQLDNHFLRPVAVLVLIIFPDLVHLHLGLFSVVVVCDLVLESAIISFVYRNGRCVIIDRNFLNGVEDSRSVLVLRKISPGISPVVILVQFDVSNLSAVFQQVNSDFRGLIAVLVVGIVPNLKHLHLGLGRCMAVCQRSDRTICGSIGQRISAGQVLLTPGVGDRLAVSILQQVINGGCPVVRRTQRNGANLGGIIHQVNRQAFRTDAVLVVRVRPFLGNCRGSFFLYIGNCYLPAVIIIRIVICRCSEGVGFNYIIGKSMYRSIIIVEMARKCIPFIAPVVAVVQGHGVNYRKLLIANDIRNRLQSILDLADRVGGRIRNIREAVGSNKPCSILQITGFYRERQAFDIIGSIICHGKCDRIALG